MSEFSDFVDAVKERTSIVAIAGRKLAWDTRKSQPSKGDMWAPCPFHSEKTASFHVDERKGFYYCFGCHAKGNVFSFVMEVENIAFMDALKRLAGEAGMALPKRDPKAVEKHDRHMVLYDIMEQASKYFRAQLASGQGVKAREYLNQRGLDQPMLEAFEIGFAPNAQGALLAHLRANGVSERDIIEAGLAAKPDDGRASYDRFRGRIIFPIRDKNARVIAFGGRAMAANATAKYLNSPQTPIFNKGRALYNVGQAQAHIGQGEPLIVCEGYMDVIALAQAGFGACVAPLGTALSEAQLAFLWRLAPEPIITLDGDTAGLRAAYRLIELALPMISPERRLKFCLLPESMDPDDVVKKQGKAAMGALLKAAIPLIELIWRRETYGKIFKTPEQRASLEGSLRALAQKISEPSLRRYYEAEFKNRLWNFFRASPKKTAMRAQNTAKKRGDFAKRALENLAPAPTTKASLLAGDIAQQDQILEESILAILLRYPEFCEVFSEALSAHDFVGDNRVLQSDILNFQGPADALFEEISKKNPDRVKKLYAHRYISILPVLARRDAGMARAALDKIFAQFLHQRGVEQEIVETLHDFDGAGDESLTHRLRQLSQTPREAENSDESVLDIENNRQELKKLTEKLLNDRVWVKKKS